MVAADALVPNRHQAISNHHAVNTDSSRDFIGHLSVKITFNMAFIRVIEICKGVNLLTFQCCCIINDKMSPVYHVVCMIGLCIMFATFTSWNIRILPCVAHSGEHCSWHTLKILSIKESCKVSIIYGGRTCNFTCHFMCFCFIEALGYCARLALLQSNLGSVYCPPGTWVEVFEGGWASLAENDGGHFCL